MITITKKQNIVYNQIKYIQAEFGGEVSPNILKIDLNMSEHDVKEILGVLIGKGLIIKGNDDRVLIKGNQDVKVVDSKADVKREELDQLEQKSFDIIKSIVDGSSMVSRHILEGNLLYGDLKVSTFRMYHIIISLENKGLLKKIKKSDGEYYIVNPV
ncbi:MAG: hypothetical protein ACP5C3_03465 [Methanomicrobiales archaeon]